MTWCPQRSSWHSALLRWPRRIPYPLNDVMSSAVFLTLGFSPLTEENSISSGITARVSLIFILLQETLSLHWMMCSMKRRTSSTCTSPIWPALGEWCHWYDITTYSKAANINWCTVTLLLWYRVDVMVSYRMYRENDNTEDLYNILETYFMQVIDFPFPPFTPPPFPPHHTSFPFFFL